MLPECSVRHRTLIAQHPHGSEIHRQGAGAPAIGARDRRVGLPCGSNFGLFTRDFARKSLRQPLSVRAPANNAFLSAPRWPSCGSGRSAPFASCGRTAHRKRQLFANPTRPQNRAAAFPGRHARRQNRNPRMMPCLPGRNRASGNPNRAPARTRRQKFLYATAAWRRPERTGNRAARRGRVTAGSPDDAPDRTVVRCGYAA